MTKYLFLIYLCLLLPSSSIAQEDGSSSLESNQTQIENKNDIFIENNFFTGVLSGGVKQYMLNFLMTNPFSKMSKKDVSTMLELKLQDMPVGNFLKSNPKVLNATVDVIRDQKAIPSFFSIINKTDKLKTYGITILCVFVFAFILNLKSRGNVFKRILKKLLIMLFSLSANLIAFLIIFREELRPGIDIILRYF